MNVRRVASVRAGGGGGGPGRAAPHLHGVERGGGGRPEFPRNTGRCGLGRVLL